MNLPSLALQDLSQNRNKFLVSCDRPIAHFRFKYGYKKTSFVNVYSRWSFTFNIIQFLSYSSSSFCKCYSWI
jgi:hypothetical protein